jgi:hypothetical protein
MAIPSIFLFCEQSKIENFLLEPIITHANTFCISKGLEVLLLLGFCCFQGAGDLTQGPMHARQVLCHWASWSAFVFLLFKFQSLICCTIRDQGKWFIKFLLSEMD